MSKELSLLDHCTEVTTITCGCGKEEKDNSGVMECLEGFYEAGWRNVKGVCKCPECAGK